MKTWEVVWSVRAMTELDEILAYIRSQDPKHIASPESTSA
jgi:hypothetical protein